MPEPFIGEIRVFPFNYAPVGWAKCDGQLLSTKKYPALHSLIGHTHGGDGKETFALPDYRGRIPMQWGESPFFGELKWAEYGGEEGNTLTEVPRHTHDFFVSRDYGDQREPDGRLLASEILVPGAGFVRPYAPDANITLNPGMVHPAGSPGPEPVNNLQPYQVLNFCIALEGIYPTRG